MVHVVWLATTSKKMLIGQAMDIGIGCLDARRSLFVARRAIAACFNRFPMVGDAFKKLVVVAFPIVVCTISVFFRDRFGLTLSGFGIAHHAIAACFNRFPMVGDAFKKLVVVAIPSAIGACRRIRQFRRIIFWRVRFIASDGDERDCHERQPVMFVVFHYAIPHLSLG